MTIYDPIECPKCGKLAEVYETYHAFNNMAEAFTECHGGRFSVAVPALLVKSARDHDSFVFGIRIELRQKMLADEGEPI